MKLTLAAQRRIKEVDLKGIDSVCSAWAAARPIVRLLTSTPLIPAKARTIVKKLIEFLDQQCPTA